MSDIKRFNAQEQKGMINLLGIISQSAFLEDEIGRRIDSVPRGKFRLKGAMTNLSRLAGDLIQDMPEQ